MSDAETVAVRLPNWVGDTCMALPVIQGLAAAGLRVHTFGRCWSRELLAGEPVVPLRAPRPLRAAARAYRPCPARRVLLLTNSFSTAAAARLAGLRATGYRGDNRSLLLARAVEPPAGRLHEVERFWHLARAFIGARRLPERPPERFALRLTSGHHAAAEGALKQAAVQQPFLAAAPLAVGTIDGKPKAWPGFTELGQRLATDGMTLVTCPGPGEEQASAKALPFAVPLTGLGLGAAAAVYARALGVVANDSGHSHLAAAAGAQVVTVFGLGEPWRTAPWGGAVVGSERGWPEVDEVHMALAAVAT